VTPSGSGNGTLTAEYDANTGAGTRIATITVSGSGTIKQLVTVTQSGTAPVLTVTPQNRDVTYPAGETTFDVVSNIEWTSSSDQAWCTVLPSGTGNGIITASYGEQTATTSRTATITISGPGVNSQIVTVTQSGVPPTLLVTPPNQYVASSPGTAGFDVASNTDWSASSDQDWCIVTGSGSGNGTITAAFEANTTPLVRIANITVTGQGANDQVVTITQDELITISYSDSPWCPSGDLQNVILSGTPGGIYSAEPDGLGIDPATGDIDPAISAAGSYTVKYTLEKSQGNRVIEAVTGVAIRVTFTPQIAIKWDDVLICPNLDNAILSYQWYKDSSPIAGATGQYYVTSRIQGSYSVEVEETNGCKVMSDAINMGSAKAAVIYPNPVRSTFKISLGDVPEGKVQIRITDMAGNEVMHLDTERSGAEYEKEIPAGQLENGLYSVQITVNGISMYFAKIMVIK
jgi:flagellar hook assembly protein FlgD